jgi:hypothetical protein
LIAEAKEMMEVGERRRGDRMFRRWKKGMLEGSVLCRRPMIGHEIIRPTNTPEGERREPDKTSRATRGYANGGPGWKCVSGEIRSRGKIDASQGT